MNTHWKKIVLSASHTLLDALRIINDDGGRIGLIVDEQHRLIGVITDGDIRRALLKNIDLSSPVSTTMNRNPISAINTLSRSEILKIMQDKSIIAIPIVDETNTLVGLETWNVRSKHRVHPNPVFIMAGGFGTRLKPLTDNCPKPMLKVGDKPILEILVMQFIEAGFYDFYISTHYMPEQIMNHFGDGKSWGVKIKYVHEELPLGTGGALGLLPDDTPAMPLIMINGDVLTTVDFERLLEFHEKYKPKATMCVREYDYQIPYGVIKGDGYHVISMQEKPIQRYFVNAGIYVVSPELFASVPKNKKIDMPTLLEIELSKDEDVIMFPIHEYWLDIGRMDDFNKAQVDIIGLIK